MCRPLKPETQYYSTTHNTLILSPHPMLINVNVYAISKAPHTKRLIFKIDTNFFSVNSIRRLKLYFRTRSPTKGPTQKKLRIHHLWNDLNYPKKPFSTA